MRHAVAVVLLLLAGLVLALGASLVHGIAGAYGPDTPGLGEVAVVAGAVSWGLVLLCLAGARDPVGRRPGTSVLAVAAVVVVAGTLWGAHARGAQVHERNRTAPGPPCAPDEVALLDAVDAPGTRSRPVDAVDVGCWTVVSSVSDVDLATATVAVGLEEAGWRLTGLDAEAQRWERGEAVLRVSATADGETAQVRLTLVG